VHPVELGRCAVESGLAEDADVAAQQDPNNSTLAVHRCQRLEWRRIWADTPVQAPLLRRVGWCPAYSGHSLPTPKPAEPICSEQERRAEQRFAIQLPSLSEGLRARFMGLAGT